MKKSSKVILAILIFSLILAAAIIPFVSSFSYLRETDKTSLDVTWYQDTANGVEEVEIPNRIETKENETCTIYTYFDNNDFSYQTDAEILKCIDEFVGKRVADILDINNAKH